MIAVAQLGCMVGTWFVNN